MSGWQSRTNLRSAANNAEILSSQKSTAGVRHNDFVAASAAWHGTQPSVSQRARRKQQSPAPSLPDLPKKAAEGTPEPNSGFEGPTGISIFIDDSGLGIAILRKRQRHDLETINTAAKNVRELVDRLFDIASVPSASE